MDMKIRLKYLPQRTEQNPHILSNKRQYAECLLNLLYSPKKAVAEQKLSPRGTWGYSKLIIPDEWLVQNVKAHLCAEKTLGFYAYGDDLRSKWLCIDIDLQGGVLDEASEQPVLDAVSIIRSRLDDLEVPEASQLIEYSGSKGMHIWILINPVEANYAQCFWGVFLQNLQPLPAGIKLDLYPHPATDAEEKEYGSLVKVPLGMHRKVEKFSCLIEADGREIAEPLATLKRVTRWSLPAGLPPLDPKRRVHNKRAKQCRRGKASPAAALAPVPVPQYTERYNQLISGCAFLRGFHDHPDRASYHEWRRAGMILSHLGPDGQEWFRHLSASDVARFDETSEDVISSVTSRGYKPPTCKTIGCSQCDKCSPFQHLDPSHQFYVRLPGERPEYEELTFEELGKQLEDQLREELR